MDVRTRILQAAAGLLAAAPDGDISTRAVCEAAGVSAPALYRHFTDKDGLLAAVVDFGFEQYLASKRATAPTGDPVQDLRRGWDNHIAFAVENPNYYKLMYSPVLTSRPEAAAEAQRMLTAVVERVAAAGRLAVPVPLAAQMIMAANAGVALALLYRPELNTDPRLSAEVRDAVIGTVTTAALGRRPAAGGALAATATTLSAQLRERRPEALTSAETLMLQEWLGRLERTHPTPEDTSP